jgi:hypothetical protein
MQLLEQELLSSRRGGYYSHNHRHHYREVTPPTNHRSFVWQEEFEEANGVIRSGKSKDRQHNGQKKWDKQNNIQKTKDRATRTPLKTMILILVTESRLFFVEIVFGIDKPK